MSEDAPDNPPSFWIFYGSGGCDICVGSTCLRITFGDDPAPDYSAHYNCGCPMVSTDYEGTSQIVDLDEPAHHVHKERQSQSLSFCFGLEPGQLHQASIGMPQDHQEGEDYVWDAIRATGFAPMVRRRDSVVIGVGAYTVTTVTVTISYMDYRWNAKREWDYQTEEGPWSMTELAPAFLRHAFDLVVDEVVSVPCATVYESS